MITVKNLSLHLENKIILDNLCISFQEKKIHGLVGINGAGKTSFLHTLFGYYKYNTGNIYNNEQVLTKKQIAYVETENFFYSYITAHEYLNLFNDRTKKFNQTKWLELFHIPAHQLIDQFSTGMKKKLALLSAIKLDKAVLLLDEPFNALDLESNLIFIEILFKLRDQGKTIILTSHSLDLLKNVSNEIHHLKNGKIDKSYQPDEFVQLEKNILSQINTRVEELLK